MASYKKAAASILSQPLQSGIYSVNKHDDKIDCARFAAFEALIDSKEPIHRRQIPTKVSAFWQSFEDSI